MTDKETLLFVGGSADGERREVPRGAPYCTVYEKLPVRIAPYTARDASVTIPIKHEQYRREWLQDGRRRYAVMVLDRPEFSLIEALLDGYRRLQALKRAGKVKFVRGSRGGWVREQVRM